MHRHPTRRLVAVAVAAALAAACSDSSDDAAPATAEPAAAATASATGEPTETTAADAFPVSIEHAYGTTEIPSEPVRVVTVGYNDQDPVLALGVVPVGVMPWYEDDPIGFDWTIEAYGDALPEQVGGGEFLQIDFEKVAALRPDLIVGASGMREVDYDVARQIAPTIPQPPGELEYSSAPWQDTQRYVGRALGRSAEADAIVADVEAQIAAARDAHPEFQDARAVVAEVYDGQFAVRGSAEVWSEFLAEIGFVVPDEIVGPEYTPISSEQVELFGELDVVVWLGTPEEVGVNPIYGGLPVATAGRDVYVESLGTLSGAIGFNSALSLPIVVDELVPKLAAAIDGDPATAIPG